MPPRKSTAAPVPAVTVEVVPVDPDAGVTFADHRAASAMMLRALAGLDAATALDRLRTVYGSLPNGTARRAVLAARLAILRDDLPKRVKPAALPVAAPAVIKAPLKAGAVSTLALDAAAKLLFDADVDAEDDPPPPPPPPPPPQKSKAAPKVADLFAALSAAEADDAADDWATPDVAAPGADLDRGISELEQGDAETASVFVPIPPAVMASALSIITAFDEGAEDAPLPDAPPAPKPTFDLGAAFAAFADSEDAPVSPLDDAPAPPDAPELVKATAPDLPGGDIVEPLPAAMDPPDIAQGAPLSAAEGAVPQATKPKRKKPTNLSDVSAAFAAMGSDGAE